VIGVAGLKSILPHRYPMLLLDRVTEVVPGERLVAFMAVSRNEQWYRDLPPDADERAHDYPAVLVLESWCQAAAVLGAKSARPGQGAGRMPLLGGLTDVRVYARVRPGDVVEHRVRLTRDVGEALLLEGESTVAGRLVLRIGRATVALRAPV
jgi:3-hydroxyacyl-[acyl-carrier-protein] dehydratase